MHDCLKCGQRIEVFAAADQPKDVAYQSELATAITNYDRLSPPISFPILIYIDNNIGDVYMYIYIRMYIYISTYICRTRGSFKMPLDHIGSPLHLFSSHPIGRSTICVGLLTQKATPRNSPAMISYQWQLLCSWSFSKA